MTQDYPTALPPAGIGSEFRERVVPVGPVQPGPDERQAAEAATAKGRTRIADGVVAKIVALAAKEIPGVHGLGRGTGQAVAMPAPGAPVESVAGVAVEVGDATVAVDLGLVTVYGQSIARVTEDVRRNVVGRVEGMTGLRVTEVDITVEDLHVGPPPEGGDG